MTEELVNSIEKNKADIAICGYKKEFEGHIEKILLNFDKKCINKKNFIQNFDFLYKNWLYQGPCNKLYKIELLKKYNILFWENLSLAEDAIFNTEVLKNVKKISVVNKALYIYVLKNNTLSTTYNDNHYEIHKLLFEEVEKFFGTEFEAEAQILKFKNISISLQYYFLNCNKIGKESLNEKMLTIVNEYFESSCLNKNIKFKTMKEKIEFFLFSKRKMFLIKMYFKIKIFISKNILSRVR